MHEVLASLMECVEHGKVNQVSPYPPHLKGKDGSDELTKKALEANIPPEDILSKALIVAMEKVGVKFTEKKIFVPQMLLAAKAMAASMKHLKPFFQSGSVKVKGTFIIGTVSGDLHDIGKNLVTMMIEGSGWKVIDLGVDVPSEKFLEVLNENPEAVVGLSALLTTTMNNMADIVEDIKKASPKTPVIVGGAPLNKNFCDKIGADHYSPDPQGAVNYLKQLVA